MKKCSLIISFPLFVVAFSCYTNNSPKAEIRNAMLECVEESITPGMGLGYYSEKAGTIMLAIGQSDMENNTPLKTSTHYPIQSVSKMFISILTLQMIEEGVFTMESSIDEWIDSIPKGSKITIRHLLNHTSGLRDYRRNTDYFEADDSGYVGKYSSVEMIKAGLEISVDTEIGVREYSNTNALMLARIIETITQQSLGNVLRERIFLPAEMNHSYYKPEILNDTTYIVKCYKFGEAIDLDWINYTSNAGGGIISTIEDMLNFGKWILENEYHVSMAAESELIDLFDSEGTPIGQYGLCIDKVDNLYSIPVLGHTGGNGGFIHFFYFSEETGEIIIHFVNEGRVGKPFGKFMKDLDETLQKYR